jgi:AraC-like DNA-binding protein
MRDVNIVIYKGNEPLEVIQTKDRYSDVIQRHASLLLSQTTNCGYIIVSSLMAYGIVRDKDTDYSILFGPYNVLGMVSETALRDYIVKENVDLNLADKIKDFISGLPMMTIGAFFQALSALDAAVNHEIPYIKAPNGKDGLFKPTFDDVYADNQDEIPSTPKTPAYSFEEEKRMMECIRSGNFKGLFLFYGKRDRMNYSSAPEALREHKNRCFALLSLVNHSAMEGGLDPSTAYLLQDIYMKRIEEARSIPDTDTMQGEMIKDYCTRISSINFLSTDNPVINRAMACINEHLREKLTGDIIGEYLHISPSYLSARFKKKTGLDLPSYINQQKITEAKRLLAYTDKPLADISNYLSFSSQSYFQNIFKKVTGTTPKQYRAENNKHFI